MSHQSGPNRSEGEPRFTRPLTVENALDLLRDEMEDEPLTEGDDTEADEDAEVIDLRPPQDPSESDPQNPRT